MIILDTDHLSTLKYSDSKHFVQLAGKMADSHDQDFVTTVITLEEQMRGWLARIKRASTIDKEIVPYQELIALVDFFSYWKILPLDQTEADEFEKLRQQKIRIGSMDMKIAAIALANNALLLTANTRHFGLVPNLRIEDWIN